MRRPAGLPIVLAAAIGLWAPDAGAQTFELGIFGGLGFGGSLVSTVGFEEYPLQSGALYGGTVAVEFLPSWRLEAQVMRQESKVRGTSAGSQLDVHVDRYMAGVHQQERLSDRVDIFGEFLLGATRYVPAGFESELWFTLGAGAGFKMYVTRNVGFRFEARAYYTPVSISGRVYCGPYGCAVGYTGAGTFQGDVCGGLMVVF